VYRLAVRQQGNSQVAIFNFHNLHPAPNSTVGLNVLPQRSPNGALNPFVTDQRAVGAQPNRSEVGGDFHTNNLPDLPIPMTDRPDKTLEQPVRFAGTERGVLAAAPLLDARGAEIRAESTRETPR